MKHGFLFALALLIGVNVNAQNINEAAILTQNNSVGTARSLALGNAFTALGANAYSFASNPAGLGYYRKSEVSFGTVFQNTNITTSFLGSNNIDNSSKFLFGNISYVQTQKISNKNKTDDWQFFNWGVSFHRKASFNEEYRVSGINKTNSIVDYFVAQSNGIPAENLNISSDDVYTLSPNEVIPYMGWQTYLTYEDTSDIPNQYANFISGGGNKQTVIGQTKGGKSELNFALSGNYANKWYFGGSINVPFIRYENRSIFKETDNDDEFENFDSAEFLSDDDIEGVGISASFGASYKATDWIRIGASLKTPEWFSVTTTAFDELNTEVVGSSESIESFTSNINYDPYSYNFRTPLEVNLGAAFFIENKGFVSLDYNFTPYNKTRYNTDNSIFDSAAENELFNQLNTQIEQTFKGSSTFKIGAEYYVIKNLSLRAGYSYLSSPFQNNNVYSPTQNFSGGLGLNFKRANIDIAYIHSINDLQYQSYGLSIDAPTSNWEITKSKLATTVSFKF